MDKDRTIKKYFPMTETAFYILFSLVYKRHGYEIINYVEKITNKRLSIGAGTIYGTLAKFEKDGLILCVEKDERRKTYIITDLGKQLLIKEIERVEEINHNCNCIKEKLYERQNCTSMVDPMVLQET